MERAFIKRAAFDGGKAIGRISTHLTRNHYEVDQAIDDAFDAVDLLGRKKARKVIALASAMCYAGEATLDDIIVSIEKDNYPQWIIVEIVKGIEHGIEYSS